MVNASVRQLFSPRPSSHTLLHFPIFTVLFSFLLTCSADARSHASQSAIEHIEHQEIIRRTEDFALAKQMLLQADKAAAVHDYGSAYALCLNALGKIPTGSANARERKTAISQFSRMGIHYAQWLIRNGLYAEAEDVTQSILLTDRNPTYKPAINLLSKLQQPQFFNKTITPEFVAQQNHIRQQLESADEAIAANHLDRATRTYEEILASDPYNNAATKGLKQANEKRQAYYDAAYQESHTRMMWEVSRDWTLPPRRRSNQPPPTPPPNSDRHDTESLHTKLNQIIIPHIDFKDVTLREAIQFLAQQSQRLDKERDPSGTEKPGINIVLKLTPSLTTATTTADPSSENRISLSLNNVPLSEALRYLAELAGLRIKVEPYAVALVSSSDSSEKLITKEYRVPPGFIPPAKLDTPQTTNNTQFTGLITPGPGIASRLNAQHFLEEQGIAFPPGATARYIATGSKLVVRNTPDNIDLIDSLVSASIGAPPTQVEIESKFIEITENNLADLGFDWLLGPVAIPTTSNSLSTAGGVPLPIDATGQYPFPQSNGIPHGTNSITQGLRSSPTSRSAVSPTGLDSLLNTLTGSPVSAVSPAAFAIAGILTNPQFQVIIRALNQKKGIDLMTAPKVATKSGQKATVKIVRRFSYPTQFDPPQIPQSTSIATGTNTGLQSTALLLSTPPTITPSHPTGWTDRDVGVTLSVEPIIGPDTYTIDLALTPEVVDFEGFINYGSPITSIGRRLQGPLLVPEAQVLTNNTINQPIFSTRRVTTNVSIWDGQTVALGGLIREDIQKIRDKVPFLGDIPLAGHLFRTTVDQKIKRNLIIFVTARIIDAKGAAIRREE